MHAMMNCIGGSRSQLFAHLENGKVENVRNAVTLSPTPLQGAFSLRSFADARSVSLWTRMQNEKPTARNQKTTVELQIFPEQNETKQKFGEYQKSMIH